jgi:uncharacterized protein (DUF1778 family)
MTKSKRNNNKAKLNLTVREQQRNKLEQMASLENRSLSNLIEVISQQDFAIFGFQEVVICSRLPPARTTERPVRQTT